MVPTFQHVLFKQFKEGFLGLLLSARARKQCVNVFSWTGLVSPVLSVCLGRLCTLEWLWCGEVWWTPFDR